MATQNTFYTTCDEEIGNLPIEQLVASPFKIEPILPYAMYSSEIAQHVREMEQVVASCIPSHFLGERVSFFQTNLLSELPLLKWNKPENSPGCLELSLLCIASKEDSIANKLESILKEWLVPGKTTTLLSIKSLYFHWDQFLDKSFLVLTAKCLIESGKDLSKALSLLPAFSMQITSSLKNPQSLKDFFSLRPLIQEFKQTQVHQQLVLLMEKLPLLFNSDLLLEMSRFFALCPKSFCDPRAPKLITKILAFHFLMRTNLLRLIAISPEKKHLEIRYIRTNLTFHFGSKPVLGLVLAISPLGRHEFFEEYHIAQATQMLLPGTRVVKGSFYTYQGPQDPICTLYLELEKENGASFSSSEIRLLKQDLEEKLKRCVEKLVPSVFMARNEEETMRNILILSQELKRLSDIPQVMISLDSHTVTEISFTIVLVRILKAGTPPLAKNFATLKSEALFVSDRVQQVGFLKKTTPKEAHVFHLRFPKNNTLLRADNSVNFYLARNKASSILFEAIGPFRDYNGGMILKQGELFYQFQETFSAITIKNPELLENFFFSLNPIEVQATLPLSSLEILFNQLLEAQKIKPQQKEDYFIKIEEHQKQLFTTIRVQDSSFKQELFSILTNQGLCSKSLIQSCIQIQESLYVSIIFPQVDEKKQNLIISILHEVIKKSVVKIQNQQVLTLSFLELPQSLDPRLAGDDYSHTITKMLFEGLTRLTENGKPELAAAKSVEISKDLKSYLFKLKKCYWSNGSPVSAQDFAYTWKKILSPNFTTPFAHLFYPIKNAKAAKENRCPLENVGITVLDDLSLLVELEHSTPEFLELTAYSTYSPVHHVIDKIHPNWSLGRLEDFVCNGPFVIKKITNHTSYELTKNSFYWDKDHVRLQKILLSKNTTLVANEMFKNEEIHWLGRPMHPWEGPSNEIIESFTVSAPIGVHWCIFNTEKFPFHNTNLRKAFDLAIDKNALTKEILYGHLPASTPLPLSHTLNHSSTTIFGNETEALRLFELALKELGLSKQTFPLITLNFTNTPFRKSIATYLTKRWKDLFQISCRSEGFAFNTLFNKILKGDFQTVCLSWKPHIDTPSFTLNAFKYGNQDINFAKWANPEYQKLLELERGELNPVQKITLLSKAEQLLMQEVPLFSLFYEREQNIKKNNLHQVLYSKTTGLVDFKHAYLERR